MQLLWFLWNSPFFVPNTQLRNHKQMSKKPQSAGVSRARARSLSALFHFLSRRVWLRYFHISSIPSQALTCRSTRATGPCKCPGGGGTKTVKCTHPCSPLCSDLSNKSTIMRSHLLLFCFYGSAAALYADVVTTL